MKVHNNTNNTTNNDDDDDDDVEQSPEFMRKTGSTQKPQKNTKSFKWSQMSAQMMLFIAWLRSLEPVE